MKKIIFSILLISLLLVGCNETDTNRETTKVTKEEKVTTVEKRTTENITTSEVGTTSEVAEENTTSEISEDSSSEKTTLLLESENIGLYSGIVDKEVNDITRTFYTFEPNYAQMFDGARCGNYVTNLGNGGSVKWDIDLVQGGSYILWIEYSSAEDLYVDVAVNDINLGSLNCKATGSWYNSNNGVRLSITLNAGRNTVVLSNNSAPAPNIDWIGISRLETK